MPLAISGALKLEFVHTEYTAVHRLGVSGQQGAKLRALSTLHGGHRAAVSRDDDKRRNWSTVCTLLRAKWVRKEGSQTGCLAFSIGMEKDPVRSLCSKQIAHPLCQEWKPHQSTQ